MKLNGGWIDSRENRLIFDRFQRNDRFECTYIPTDCNGNIVNVYENPDRYIRIPYISSAGYSKYVLQMNSVGKDTIEKYGISEYMDREYPRLHYDSVKKPLSESDTFFVDQVGRIIEEYDLAWCRGRIMFARFLASRFC